MPKMVYKGKDHSYGFICGINVFGKREVEVPDKFVKTFEMYGFKVVKPTNIKKGKRK